MNFLLLLLTPIAMGAPRPVVSAALAAEARAAEPLYVYKLYGEVIKQANSVMRNDERYDETHKALCAVWESANCLRNPSKRQRTRENISACDAKFSSAVNAVKTLTGQDLIANAKQAMEMREKDFLEYQKNAKRAMESEREESESEPCYLV